MLSNKTLIVGAGAFLLLGSLFALFQPKPDDRLDVSKADFVLDRGDVALVAVAPDKTPLWGKRINGNTVYFGGSKPLGN